jgi:hypothetical protein
MQDANVQEATQKEVIRRQEKALGEIAEKYAAGKGGVETSVSAPTGNAYLLLDKKKKEEKNAAKAKKIAADERDAAEHSQKERENVDPNSDDEGADDDHALRQIREQRLRQIQQTQREKIENIGKGHGQYREIVQDDFLKEMCSSERVVCHFYHRDFERCKIFDMHLNKLAQRHLETKFVKIDAEKTPFFTAKLLIQTIPTVVFFFDGVGRQKIIGFDGLSDGLPDDKVDEWPTIKLARLMGSAGIIDNDKIVDDDGIEAAQKARFEAMRKTAFSGIRSEGMGKAMGAMQADEDDFDLDNIEDIDFAA